MAEARAVEMLLQELEHPVREAVGLDIIERVVDRDAGGVQALERLDAELAQHYGLDEPPLDAAKRELREETGLTATHWSEVMRLHTSNSITDEVGIVYVAEGLTEGETEFEETEDLEIRKLPLAEAVAMARRGEITDAISVAALLRVALPD